MPSDASTASPPTPLLGQTGLRAFLNDSQLHELERYCRPVSKRAGGTVYRQDEQADAVYLLLDGWIELRARPPGRRVYRTVEIVGPSCTFGDETLFAEPRYLATARALEPASMLVLPAAGFERLAQTHADISAAILKSTGSCLIRTLRRSAILTQSPADVGLRLLLRELASHEGNPNSRSRPIRITHAQLAGVLHLSRETVSRMLSTLAEEGVVELGRGVIRLRS